MLINISLTFLVPFIFLIVILSPSCLVRTRSGNTTSLLLILNTSLPSVNESVDNKKDYKKIVKEYLQLKKPTRELLANLVDKILIDENRNIEIYYKIRG